jgi:outer membrane receptor for ferrienterochelin and colicin
VSAQVDTIFSAYKLSLRELSHVKVVTPSMTEQEIKDSPTNIFVISKEMILERGYLNLVEICQDIPGFDFAMFEDGGGEYNTFSKNRGVGTIGNTNIMIMVDGIIQNEISFNWSLLWNFENMLHDLEHIEIIQGPGSALYGPQAFTGIINFITKTD